MHLRRPNPCGLLSFKGSMVRKAMKLDRVLSESSKMQRTPRPRHRGRKLDGGVDGASTETCLVEGLILCK